MPEKNKTPAKRQGLTGDSPILKAIGENDYKTVQALLKENPGLVNEKDSDAPRLFIMPP